MLLLKVSLFSFGYFWTSCLNRDLFFIFTAQGDQVFITFHKNVLDGGVAGPPAEDSSQTEVSAATEGAESPASSEVPPAEGEEGEEAPEEEEPEDEE